MSKEEKKERTAFKPARIRLKVSWTDFRISKRKIQPFVSRSLHGRPAGWLDRARTERGDTIDYFRVDTVKHVDSTTWKAFKNELTTINPGFKMIAEQFGATVDGDGGMLRSGQMDSLLDFGFKGKARDFANGSIDAVDAYLATRIA